MLKQRSQAGVYACGPLTAIRTVLKADGVRGLFCGFGATLQRELPFAVIQFPLYEAIKSKNVCNEAVCGAMAGAVAAFLTTPLDVIKTRKILSRPEKSVIEVTRDCWRERKMFAGGGVRVAWISVGGFFFFGAYELMQSVLRF